MGRRLLNIAPEDTINSVQERFSAWYPYLKINFFRKSMGKGRSEISFSPEVHMSDINKNLQSSIYELRDNTSVAELEKAFGQEFGLPIQIIRRSGNLWLETSLTDHLTLDEQNNIGEEISASLPFTNLPFGQAPFGC